MTAGHDPDTFTYTLDGGSTRAVSVTVSCVDDAPVAVDDTKTVPLGAAADRHRRAGQRHRRRRRPDDHRLGERARPGRGRGHRRPAPGLTYRPDTDYCNDGLPVDTFTYTLTAVPRHGLGHRDLRRPAGRLRRLRPRRRGSAATAIAVLGQRRRRRRWPEDDPVDDPAGQRYGRDHRRRRRPDLRAGPELLQRPARYHPTTSPTP